TPGFGSHGSTRATRRHRPKKPATSQPDRSPSTIIATPPAVKTGDTTSVNALTASPSRRQESNASTSSLAESRIRPHVPCRGIGVQNSGGAGRDVENEDRISAGLMETEQCLRGVCERSDRAAIGRRDHQSPRAHGGSRGIVSLQLQEDRNRDLVL